jgi:CHASE3 domain sensor protein
MKEKIEQRIIGIFVLMVAILLFISWSAVNNIQESIKSSDWVNRTHDFIIQVNSVLSSLHGGDAALRTYLMTGDARDQGYYRASYAEMIEHLEEAKALTRTGEEKSLQNSQVAELEGLIKARIEFTGTVVHARQQDGMDAARKLLTDHPDIESMSKIERIVKNISIQERSLLKDRDRDAHLKAQATRTTVYIGVAVNFALLVFVVWLMRDDLAARRRNQKLLEEANATLEAKVQERTAELVKANATLKQENLERKWSYQALDHQLRYSQLIINSINELVFVISRALNISRINPAVSNSTHWEPQDLVAQSLTRALQFTPEDLASAPQGDPISFAMRQGREINDREAMLLNKSGTTTAVRYSLFPLRDQDKVVGAVVTVRLQNAAPKRT